MIEKVLLCIINGNEEKDDFYILEQQNLRYQIGRAHV